MLTNRALFARHNLRCTSQRLALYEALRQCKSHPTAEELYRMVRPSTGRLSLATVYNTLEALCRAGLCRKLPTTGGCCRYDADLSEHLHIVFRDTGEIRDLPDDLSRRITAQIPDRLLSEVGQRLGASIEGVSIQFLARRPNGRKRSKAAPGT